MSRLPHPPAVINVETGPMPENHALAAAETELREITENTLKLADQIGYDGPLTLGGAEDHARGQMRRTVNECLELGKTLLIIKELTPHGGFRDRIELLGLNHTAAKRFMQATLKFSKGASTHLLTAVGNQTKLLELLVLDDDEVMELSENGSTRGIKLDDIDRMGASELRKALKDARETNEARDTLIKNKQARIDRVEEENHKLKRRVETTTPEEAVLEIRKEADRIAFVAEHEVSSNLRRAFDALAEKGGQHSEFMLGLITQIELACDVLRGDFGLLKAGPDGDSTPYWERQPAAAGVS